MDFLTGLLGLSGEGPINLAPIMYGIIAILGIIGALKGLSRGISRQFVRSLTVVASAIICFIFVSLCFARLEAFLSDKTMADVETWILQTGLIPEGTDTGWIRDLDKQTLELILTIPVTLIVMPLLFVICFIVVSTVMLIVHWILCAIFGFKKRRNNFITRLLGMALGALQGVAVAGLIMMPVIGLGNSLSESVALLNEKEPDSSFTVSLNENYGTYVASVTENPAAKTLGKLGINAVYKGLATVEINGKKESITELFPTVTMAVGDATKLYHADPKNLTPENEAAIKSILERVEGNDYLTRIVAGTIRSVAYTYTDGVISLNLGEPFDSIIDSAMEIFHTTDETNLTANLNTIADVYFILSQDGVLTAFSAGSDAMLNALTTRDSTGETAVTRVITTIKANERTKPLVVLITKISVSVMSQQAGLGEDTLETYESIKTGINENILSIEKEDYETEEEYVEEISTALDTTLKENNITLEKEIVDTMAQYVADNFSEVEEITDEQASDIILSYYDAYLEYLETGEIPEDLVPPNFETE